MPSLVDGVQPSRERPISSRVSHLKDIEDWLHGIHREIRGGLSNLQTQIDHLKEQIATVANESESPTTNVRANSSAMPSPGLSTEAPLRIAASEQNELANEERPLGKRCTIVNLDGPDVVLVNLDEPDASQASAVSNDRVIEQLSPAPVSVPVPVPFASSASALQMASVSSAAAAQAPISSLGPSTSPLYAPNSDTVFALAATTERGSPKLDVALDDLCAQDFTYDFSDTMWDVIPFCGLGVITLVDQCFVLIVALLNVGFQGCFIGLLTSMLDNQIIDDSIVSTMRNWRVSYAHNPNFADVFTDEPLAVGICAKSFFNMHGATQAALYRDLDEYTRPFLAMPGGGLMCLLCTCLWILTCAKELKRSCLFFIGIWTSNTTSSRTRSPQTDSFVQVLDKPLMWMYGEAQQRNYQIIISQKRATYLTILVFLPRLIILCLLGIAGCFFLSQTLQLTELILNAVALDVVMTVDELLFHAFAPQAAIRMVRKTMPLRIPRMRRICTHGVPWLKLALAAAVMSMIGWLFLGPKITTMNDVMRVMCDGEKHFLAVALPFGPIVALETSSTVIDQGSYRYRAMYQRTMLPGVPGTSLYFSRHPIYSASQQNNVVSQITAWRDQSIEDVAKTSSGAHYAECEDFIWHAHFAPFAMASGVGSITGTGILKSCRDVLHLCFNDTSSAGKAARLVCPETCDASVHPGHSGLLFNTPDDGLPSKCELAADWQGTSCEDASLPYLLNITGWRHYAEGLLIALNELFIQAATPSTSGATINLTHLKWTRDELWTGLMTRGCGFNKISIPRLDPQHGPFRVLLCDPKESFLRGRRSIRPFCPKTCRCDTNVKKHNQYLIWGGMVSSVIRETQCPWPCLK